MKKQFLVLGLLAAMTAPAFAEGAYVFGDLGQSTLNASDSESGWKLSKDDTTVGIGAGYSINKNFAVELGYRDYGSVTFFDDVKLEGTAIQASAIGKLPVSDVVDVYGRLGLARVTYEASGGGESGSDTKTKALFGVGASYALSDKFSLRAEYGRHAEWDDLYASTLTVGAVYNF
jgi:OmpA-OmpF porin, OOP family